MIPNKLRIFLLLIYKNFLVYKRHWKTTIFIEIFIPILIFGSLWSIRNVAAKPPTVHKNETHDAEPIIQNFQSTIFAAPDNELIQSFMSNVLGCLKVQQVKNLNLFKTEEELIASYQNQSTKLHNILAVVFENHIQNDTTTLPYKILTSERLPPTTMDSIIDISSQFDKRFVELQLCMDLTFIGWKNQKPALNLKIDAQQMPIPAHAEAVLETEILAKGFSYMASIAFLIPLCIETSISSKEKFLGVNVLMAMNGVSNLMNLVSWLISGLMISLFYVTPVVIVLGLTSSEQALPFLNFGNPFMFWLVLIMHLAHSISFGMHIAAYFTRSLFVNTGLFVVYMISISIQSSFHEKYYHLVPFMGIIFPNMLLIRIFDEVSYYEHIKQGIHLNNLFRVGNPTFGVQGSMGMVMIFSLLGCAFHFVMTTYIYAINPGKYGARQNPFFFLKYLQRTRAPNHYNQIENTDLNYNDGEPFEQVPGGVFTPGIQVRNLRKTYISGLLNKTNVYALKGISVDFYQGQITVLLGHNGAGKTTMMSILTGMISPTEGIVVVNGRSIRDDLDEIMRDVGLCPQENMLFPDLSVMEQLKFFALLKNSDKANQTVDSQVKSSLEKLNLMEKQDALPHELSGGQKRRVCLGMALVGDASTIILDEPTSGLDPESRRDIWNILLKIRERKTVLISTHDMEEADILGDRIAVVHNGLLRSYGTSMFLKRLLGQGNIEITLSVESWSDREKILSYLDPQSKVVSADGGKLVLSVPSTQSLPDDLDNIESNKQNLGVTGISVSLITLEQVFLKVTQDSYDSTDSRERLIENNEKLEGKQLFISCAKALLHKKLTYTKKNITTPLAVALLLFLSLVCIAFILVNKAETDPEAIPINLAMYYDSESFYRTDPQSKYYGDHYKLATEGFDERKSRSLDQNRSISDALMELAEKDMLHYNYQLVCGADLNQSSDSLHARVFYNPKKALYALPISVNLLTNALIKAVAGEEYSINLYGQNFPEKQQKADMLLTLIIVNQIADYTLPIVFVFCLYPAIALFVIHPLRENTSNIKHLQRMSGASGLNYWGTMFAFDLALWMGMVLLFAVGFFILDMVFFAHIFMATEYALMITLLLLLAVNVLPITYILSFPKKAPSTAIKVLSLVPIILVTVELCMHGIFELVKLDAPGTWKTFTSVRPIQRIVFLFTPYVGFFHGIMSLFQIARENHNCATWSSMEGFSQICQTDFHIKCCEMGCTNGTCTDKVKYFGNFSEDISLEIGFLSLCLTPLLYFGILTVLESRLVQIMFSSILGENDRKIDDNYEDQVKKEKEKVAAQISTIENSQEANSNELIIDNSVRISENSMDLGLGNATEESLFLVYELQKQYGKVVAVQDISFGVNGGECFGLLGVNGAGKSTTFRMMTGQELPNNGVMYLCRKNLAKDRSSYLSQIGYCPQNDAIIRSLNTYDHLRLFARLRGVPEQQVESEVKEWVNKLNLHACASQPSGTYSGGNKRRLNIAISLIGAPNIVLMDEPTTGVDPAARRSLWNVIQACQNTGQAIILTSHSMEECEILCNRLAIMVDGKFVCIGAAQELKQRFGAGYNIQIKLEPERSKNEISKIKVDLENALDCQLTDENSGYLMYHVSSTNMTWRGMYDVMKRLQDKYSSIEDFSVLSSTLEQLFLQFSKSSQSRRGTTTA
ncbi:hypothetical protein QAD02_022124 [Eretmocerus hayati]|uniref:Uncharacterized protein n=1 Tax=Eretmocerus hayati TaxID=131215 RepID=A0ACC2PSE2_9HYME|nr:hypothetical protein QAD02_022124 [Eretmocerus hayati]